MESERGPRTSGVLTQPERQRPGKALREALGCGADEIRLTDDQWRYEEAGNPERHVPREPQLRQLAVDGALHGAALGRDHDVTQSRELGRREATAHTWMVASHEGHELVDTGSFEPVTDRFASLDGVVMYEGEFLASDTFVGVHHVTREGDTELYVDAAALELEGAADIGFDPEARRLAVPQLFGDTVSFFTFE